MKKLLADWSKKREKIINKHKDTYNKLLFEKSKYKTREEWKIAKFNERQGNLIKYDNFNCPKCKNRGGFLYLTEDGYEQFKPCFCVKTRKTINTLKRIGLGDTFKNKNFENFKAKTTWQKRLLKKAKEFVNCISNFWFYVGGQCGSGKTHICTSIIIELLKKNRDVYYMPWRDEITKLKSVIFNENKYGSFIYRLKSVEILYIDDFFKTGKNLKKDFQAPTQQEVNIAYEIINTRYATKKNTIFSSELSIDDLDKIDESISGRICEMCHNSCFFTFINSSLENDYRKNNIKRCDYI